MCQYSVLPPPESFGQITDNSLCICLLNTRSLQLHVQDILCDHEIMESDVLTLTETQLLPDHDISDICSKLHDFQLSFNSNEDKFCSIVCGIKLPTSIISHEKFPGFSLRKICKQGFLDTEICIGILYRKHNNSVNLFYNDLTVLVNSYNIHILLGDFNIDYFGKHETLTGALSDYTMFVTCPTHIDGSLLDHVYVKKQLLYDVDVTSVVKNVFFSDHDAVKIKMTNK